MNDAERFSYRFPRAEPGDDTSDVEFHDAELNESHQIRKHWRWTKSYEAWKRQQKQKSKSKNQPQQRSLSCPQP